MTLSQKALLFSLGLLLCCACQGQRQEVGQENPDLTLVLGREVEDLGEKIWTVFQDRNNDYWFTGNGEGVYRYDGNTLRLFTMDDGLASNQIWEIKEDQDGNLYFDAQGGVSKFDGQSFTILEPIISPENEWKSEPGDLWFKANFNTNGVYRYDGEQLYHLTLPEYDFAEAMGIEYQPNESYSPFGVYTIYQEEGGAVWFGTLMAGVYRFDTESLWIPEKELSVLDDGRVPAVRSIIQDKDGYFWLSNSQSRYRVEWVPPNAEKAGHWKYEKTEGISTGPDHMDFPYFMSAAIDDTTGDLWMLTYSNGMWRYDGEQLFHYPLTHNGQEVLLFSMYKDRSGMLWLGSHNAGTFRWNGERFEHFDLSSINKSD